MNKSTAKINQSFNQQPQQQQQTMTTDALIVNSNSPLVSDDIIMQLHEQFGSTKQIFILNSSNNTLIPSSSAASNSAAVNALMNNANNLQPIQYLVIDKDVDINSLLQDTNIFNQPTQSQQQQTLPQIQPPQQQQHTSQQQLTQLLHNFQSTKSMQNSKHNTVANHLLAQANLTNPVAASVDESIQRVHTPPPKRKKYEYINSGNEFTGFNGKLDMNAKPNSYQDVFLRFLAGEKQSTLDIVTSETVTKKPKENIYYNSNGATNTINTNNNKINHSHLSNKLPGQTVIINPPTSTININLPQVVSSSLTSANFSAIAINNNTNSTINSTTTTTSSTTSTNPLATPTSTTTNNINLDKENYYNSSRRENLIPINNYEYRNSYKDHYDNQGVRLNPAILKNLPFTTSSTPSSIQQTTTSSQQANKNVTTSSHSLLSAAMMLQHPQQQPSTPKSNSSTPINSSSTKSAASSSSIVITKTNNTASSPSSLKGSNNKTPINNVLLDHTYKLQTNENNIINKTAKSIINESLQSHQTNEIMNKTNLIDISHDLHDTTQANLNKVQLVEILNQDEVVHHQNSSICQSENVAVLNGSHHDDILVVSVPVEHQNLLEDITFMPGEFLIHKSTFTGDFDNYDIWCVLNEEYLQKYEPVLLSTGERCHQSADVLAQYTQDKNEFLMIKVEEKGKTEQNNIVVGVLSEYEPKNNKLFTKILQESLSTTNNTSTMINNHHQLQEDVTHMPVDPINEASKSLGNNTTEAINLGSVVTNQDPNVIVVTCDDLKRTFDIFLQVLLSQHLNNEFLQKIREIQDEYFKPAIDFIDTIINEKYDLLINHLNEFLLSFHGKVKLKPIYKYLLENKPKLLILNDEPTSTMKCESILIDSTDNLNYSTDYLSSNEVLAARHLIKFAGRSYNAENLTCQSDAVDDDADTQNLILNLYEDNNDVNGKLNENNNNSNHGKYLVCTKILNISQLLHALKHFKLHFYEHCLQKIELVKDQMNASDASLLSKNGLNGLANSLAGSKEEKNSTYNTDLLNNCLGDAKWLLEMFDKFKQVLFDVDNLIAAASSTTSQQGIKLANDDKENEQEDVSLPLALNLNDVNHDEHVISDKID